MSQFDISRSEEQLTLKHPLSVQVLPTGCLLFAAASLCLALLGLLGILEDAQGFGSGVAADSAHFFHPAHNHFGYFWLLGALLMLVLVPWYLVTANRSALVFTFERNTGLFLRNGRVVTRIGRIEYVCLRERQDPDEAFFYELSIVYADGHEMLIDNSYDEQQIASLAKEIAGFLETPLVWK